MLWFKTPHVGPRPPYGFPTLDSGIILRLPLPQDEVKYPDLRLTHFSAHYATMLCLGDVLPKHGTSCRSGTYLRSGRLGNGTSQLFMEKHLYMDVDVRGGFRCLDCRRVPSTRVNKGDPLAF